MPSTKRDYYNLCPHCWSIRIKSRVLKTPRYKCEQCCKEFSNKIRVSHDDRLVFNSLLKGNRINAEGLETFTENKLRGITVQQMKELIKLGK